MKIDINLILATEKVSSAEGIVMRLNDVIRAGDPALSPYHGGGTKASLSKELPALETLLLAQSFGRSWTLTGSANDEIDLVSTEITVPGIEWAQITLLKP